MIKLSASHHFTAVSSLSTDECRKILNTLTDKEGLLGILPGSKPLVGTVYDTWALMRKQIGGRNSFQVYLELDFSPNKAGTDFSGSFNVGIGTRLFILLFIAVLICAVFVILNAAITNPATSPWYALCPLGMIGFATALYASGRMSSEEDIPELLTVLEKALKLNLTHAKLEQCEPGAVRTNKE